MSSRLRVQSYLEQEVGCAELAKWKSYGSKFSQYKVTIDNLPVLKTLLAEDTEDLYFKAILSLTEAINAIERGFHSWAIVKLYYSVFYLLRCSMAARGFCFAKSSGIYTLHLTIGEIPIKRDTGTRNGENIRGDHKTVIATYLKEFGHNDIFLTNHVFDSINVYDWMMKKREDINYRNNTFFEPGEAIFNSSLFKKGSLSSKIDEYFYDLVYCFMEDHCCLALPLRLAERTAIELRELFDEKPFTKEKFEVLDGLLQEAKINRNKYMDRILFA